MATKLQIEANKIAMDMMLALVKNPHRQVAPSPEHSHILILEEALYKLLVLLSEEPCDR